VTADAAIDRRTRVIRAAAVSGTNSGRLSVQRRTPALRRTRFSDAELRVPVGVIDYFNGSGAVAAKP